MATSAGKVIFRLRAASRNRTFETGRPTSGEQLLRIGADARRAWSRQPDVQAAVGAAGYASFPATGGAGFGRVDDASDLGHGRFLSLLLVSSAASTSGYCLAVRVMPARRLRRTPISFRRRRRQLGQRPAELPAAGCARCRPVMCRCSYLAGEFLGVGTGVRVGCAIGITFKGDGGHGDDREFGKPLFQLVVFRLAFGQTEPPAVVMDHDGDVIRVVEGRRAAIERGIVELPLRRSDLPNELRELAPVFFVAERARARWQNRTDTTIRARPSAAAASCRLPGSRSDNR